MALQPHEQRVVTERDELSEKIGKLKVFTMTKKFDELEDADAILLNVQLEQMIAYERTLDCRIKRFTT